MDQRASWLVSTALLILFAYVSTYFPEHVGTLFLVYVLAVLAVTAIVAGRSAAAIYKDLEYVKSGKTLLSVSSSEVAKLKSRDRELNRELSAQTKAMAPQLVTPFVVMFALFIPAVREGALRGLASLVAQTNLSGQAGRFLTFLLFYGLLTLILYLVNYIAGRRLQRAGGRLDVPSFYLVTERGLVLEGRVPLKAPLTVQSVRVDTRRRFVELQVRSRSGLGGGVSRVRLYCENPRELEALLRSLTEERR